MRARDEELRNHDKMTKNYYSEYQNLQKRIEKIGDPLYISELKRKSIDLENRLRTLEKESKTL
jgi:hypothetical protein